MKSFVHLHNHTEYSMLDGAAKITPLFEEAHRLGMTAVGMTDHGNMYGASEFYNSAKAVGIKPVVGIEAYVAPGSRFDTTRVQWGTPEQKSDDVSGSGAYTHLTLLAEDSTGVRNLFRLSSLASIEGQFGKYPRMDHELIAQYAGGIIATTGCPSGEIQTRLRLGQYNEALESAAKWQAVFGRENYFLELMDHGLDIELRVREGLIGIGRALGIPALATNDCHYVTKAHSAAHDALLCVQTGKTLDDPARFKFGGDGYYLKSAEEMRLLWDAEVPDACDNTLLIAERVQPYDDVWEFRNRMPEFPVPEGHTQDSWLRAETRRGLQELFAGRSVPQNYEDRADYELNVIAQKGFPAYFLVVGDLVSHAKSVGIRVGPGRGSAAGSLVAYALGITGIDPLEHGLLFERFLNPERPSAPDIDIDFDDRRRVEMVRYATDKWGSDRVAQVITFGTIKTKAALKDSARVLFGQQGFAIADRISKALPPAIMAKDISVAGITDPGHDRYAEAGEVRELISTDPDVEQIYETALGLEGLIRNAGVHACAVIMSSEPLIDDLPIWKRPQDGAIITGWDYPSCEAIGLLKMDFLGLRNLTVIGDALNNIKTNRDIDLDLKTLPLDDPATYELLSRGETLGVFQLDGGPMRDLLKRMQPTGFNDIVAVLALYRPGPMGMNSHNDYADRKNARKSIASIHPELEEPLREILGETYGLIVFQEQIMLMAQKVASYSMGQADSLRKAMGKKKRDVLDAEYQRFHDGMTANGHSDSAVKALWDTTLPFVGYAFNKSHAAAYGLISYWTAYLKTHYPAEYMAALLTSVADDKDKTAVYLTDCRSLGISVLSPDVNESEGDFTAVGKDIRFGLGGIRNVGPEVVTAIIAARPYTGFAEFLDRSSCPKKVVEPLIKAGAFDSFGSARRTLIAVCEELFDAVADTKKTNTAGQLELFTGLRRIPDYGDEWPASEKLAYEREMLGLYVSGHPLNGISHRLDAQSSVSIPDILTGTIPDGTQVTVGGILTSINRRVGKKNGLPWASARLESLSGGVEVLLFSQTYAVYCTDIREDAVVLLRARVSVRDDRIALIVSDLAVPDLTADVEPCIVALTPDQATPETLAEIRRALLRYPGPAPVHLDLGQTRWNLDGLRVTPTEAIAEINAILI